MSIKSFIDDLKKEIPMYPPLTEERLARIEKIPGENLYKVSITSTYGNEHALDFKYLEEKVFNAGELESFLERHVGIKV